MTAITKKQPKKTIVVPNTEYQQAKEIVSTLDEFEFLKGKRITTAVKYFKDTWNANKDEITKVLNEGGPLWAIYG